MKQLLLATRNPGKVLEIQAILGSLPVTVTSLIGRADVPEVVEDGATLEANALKKAREVFRATGIPSLADDSGLEVYALQMRPGVLSARFAGDHVSYEENNKKLLLAMKDLSGVDRRARFRCVVAFVADGIERNIEGICEGTIVTQPRGDGGFGYDPLFVPDDYDRTFAELPPEIKNRISHRARALQGMNAVIEGYFSPA